ncbi:MAG TPA: hypothetical protein DCR93_09815 [Cytophagales bacterium]|nr:hypothetical protein [Cytophagales bacterium]HAP59774.1 hypothetical protein [Cytophagales bacterium]
MKLKYIFYLEFALSIYTLFLAAFWPEKFLMTITGMELAENPLAVELSRWYAVLLGFLQYTFMASLHQRHWYIFRHILWVLLIGDLAHLITTVTMALNYSGWNNGLFLSLGVTIFYGSTRIVALFRPQWIGRYYIYSPG